MGNPTLLYLQAASVSLPVGSLVWVEDPDVAWIDGEVLELNGSDIKVLCTSGKTVSEHMASYCRKEVNDEQVHPTNRTLSCILCTLSNTLVIKQSSGI